MEADEVRWLVGIAGACLTTIGAAFWKIIARSDTRQDASISRYERIISGLNETNIEATKTNAAMASTLVALHAAIDRLADQIHDKRK